MIIDFHTHIFPDALAPKAVASLQATAQMPVFFDGTANGLLELMKNNGIDKSVVLNTVTNTKQVDKVNSFALETLKNHNKLIPFCSLHPQTENPYEKLCSLKDNGIKGIKLHPDYVRTKFESPDFHPILSSAEELGMPVVVHAGFDPVSPNIMHTTPDSILKVMSNFPNLKLVCAHLGGAAIWDEVADKLCGANVYLDTAICCERIGITIEQGKKIFSRHPHEKILFGSDAPWTNPIEIIEFIQKTGLNNESLERIFYKNALDLLNL